MTMLQVLCVEPNGLELHESALRQVLHGLPNDMPIAVVAVTHMLGNAEEDCGHVANLVLEHLEEEPQSCGEEREAGIWMHPRPILRRGGGKDDATTVAVLVVCVKCGSSSDAAHSRRQAVLLFALSSMLSSFQILCFSHTIDSRELTYVTRCYEFAAGAAMGSSSNNDDDSRCFQQLECWVVAAETDEAHSVESLCQASEKLSNGVMSCPDLQPLNVMFEDAAKCLVLPPPRSTGDLLLLSREMTTSHLTCTSSQALFAPNKRFGESNVLTAGEVVAFTQHLCALLHSQLDQQQQQQSKPTTTEEEEEQESWAMWGLNFVPIVGTCKLAWEGNKLSNDGRVDEARAKRVQAGISLVGDLITVVSLGMAAQGAFAAKEAAKQTAGKLVGQAVGEEVLAEAGKAAVKEAGKRAVAKETGKAVVKQTAKSAVKETGKAVVKQTAKSVARETTKSVARETAKSAVKETAKAAGKTTVRVAATPVAARAAASAAPVAAARAAAPAAAVRAAAPVAAARAVAPAVAARAAAPVAAPAAASLFDKAQAAAVSMGEKLYSNPEVYRLATTTARRMADEYLSPAKKPPPPPPAPSSSSFAARLDAAVQKVDCQRILQLAHMTSTAHDAPLVLGAIRGIAHESQVDMQSCCAAVVRLVRRFGSTDLAVAEAGCDTICVLANVSVDAVQHLRAAQAHDVVQAALDNPDRGHALFLLQSF